MLVEDIVNTSDDVDSTEKNTTECGDESDKEEGEGEQNKEERFVEEKDSESNCSDEKKEDSEFDEDLLCAIEEDVSDLKMQNDLKTMCQTLSVVNASIEQCKYSKDDVMMMRKPGKLCLFMEMAIVCFVQLHVEEMIVFFHVQEIREAIQLMLSMLNWRRILLMSCG